MTRITLFIGLCMALLGCPSSECPIGTTRVEQRCFILDGAVALDAGDAPFRDACVATTWYRDRDDDDFGVAADSVTACVQPDGYVAMAGDCNDASTAAHPGVSELCNRADDDCDGASDEGLARVIGEPVVIATDNPSAERVGILPVSTRHLLLWSEFFSGTRIIVSSAISSDDSIAVAPHALVEGYPLSLTALSTNEAVLVYQPPSTDSTQLFATRMSTVLGNAALVGAPVLIENAPECCRVVVTGITDERILFAWRTEAGPETYARSCARDLTDCTPRVTLFTEPAFVTGFAGNGPNPLMFFATTLPGDPSLTGYVDRIDARTLAFENRPIRVGEGMTPSFAISVANDLLNGVAAAIIATEDGDGAREFVRFEAGALGTDIQIVGRTTLLPLANGFFLPSLTRMRGGFELLSNSGPSPEMSPNQGNWESFTSTGVASAPVSWIGPRPTSLAVAQGGFLRSEEPARLVFQRTGCE